MKPYMSHAAAAWRVFQRGCLCVSVGVSGCVFRGESRASVRSLPRPRAEWRASVGVRAAGGPERGRSARVRSPGGVVALAVVVRRACVVKEGGRQYAAGQ
ncbi:hypothetical protein E2C01_058389 [Portunus trituberculatus]|uniref:Uncharacterized protein n=1 Tax=Portunus trituberculatus TaxID=210409 RepID=A0A5B7H4K6_PORTR|nr:hypothetical protein [Portunus trituberculatus]